MFFEGNEKKVEVTVSPEARSLRQKGEVFWSRIVEAAGAKILSRIHSSKCDAYLLSESSLFVWEDHFTMITCGQTTLVRAVEAFLQAGEPSQIQALIYERKNEYFPQLQKSDFFQDARDLNDRLKGKALQFGNNDEHHLMLYSYNNNFTPPANDFTLEILMYDLQGVARKLFSCPGQNLEEIRQKTNVHRIFEGFQVDDYLFEPLGYSLNALRDEDYYTIHITPQEVGTYVSFETNVNLQQDIEPAVRRVLEVFQPQRFDIVVFSPQKLPLTAQIPGFSTKNCVQSHLDSGYFVSYSHHYIPPKRPTAPREVKI